VNGPAWPLFLELVANVIYAVLIVRLPKRALFGLIVLLLIALVSVALTLGKIQGGQDWSTIGLGFSRVMFSFTVGVLLAKSHVGDKVQSSWWSVVPAVLLCASLIYEPSTELRGLYDLVMVALGYPLIVSLGARFNPPALLASPMNVLGEISYPMYIIHYAPLFMASFAARKLGLPVALWVPAFIVGLCAVSYFLAKHYDPAARRFSFIPFAGICQFAFRYGYP
jgi:peptidoglycan/LPS O-acetylase OafA/YrhL